MAMKGALSWRNTNDGDRNPATNQYKGLTAFISDLRGARARELEEKRINKELANIRQKFRDGKLTSYDKKKYVCKLLYIYILGYDLDFGHLEAVNLVSATKFSEKQIGYLAVTLFFHEEHELLHLVVNSIRKDLVDHNELNNCLALHAIANIGGRAMAETLSADVHRLLISPTSKSFVKKKAALTLLRLYRKYPGGIQSTWAERIIAVMDDPDMGVALSVTSLVMALAQDEPEIYKNAYAKAANRLKKIVIDNTCAQGYLYYDVPCPWLQVKLLRLLQYFSPSDDTHVRSLIRDSIHQILDSAVNMPKNTQQNNAQNAVLFEAIKLVIHLENEEDLMVQMSTRLGKFILARETNVRYLGLEAMTTLASRGATSLEPIKKHQKSIVASLRDRDITVRRQALDLLYSMCDTKNAPSIVTELIRQLSVADYAIREEMVLKIAILAERYATDAQWYVDVSLRLLAIAGDHVSEEVWQRVIQIVTNNEGLQEYAARSLLRYVKAEQVHESLARIGGYVLGEFGHLIADSEGCSPIEQFLALQGKLHGGSIITKAIILSCFIKFVNLFPEIKPQLLEVFHAYSDIMDSELQQRACEYLVLANMPTDDLLRTVFDEMPPFPERASALLSRLHMKRAGASDKRAAPQPRDRQTSANIGASSPTSPGAPHRNGANGSNIMNDLNGLDSMLDEAAQTTAADSTFSLSPNWQAGYERLLSQSEGILYEDAQVQVGLRSEYKSAMGCVIVYFLNKSRYPIDSFTTTIENRSGNAVMMDIRNIPDTTLEPQGQAQQTVMFEARGVFSASPHLRITYLAGSLQSLTLRLPILLHKYMEPAELTADEFFKRWKQIGGAPREAQAVFGMSAGRTFTVESTRQILAGLNWGILDKVDPNAKNFVGATVLHTSEAGRFGCLMRLEPNFDSMLYRLTIRATGEAVSPMLLKTMQHRLAQGNAEPA